jgi:hypothetical protein
MMTTLKSQLSTITMQDSVKMYNVNDKLIGLEMSIQANVDPEESFDFTRNYNKNIHIITSLKIYNAIGNIIEKRVNKNNGVINFYSYAGGRPVSQLLNGQRNLSKLTYPPYSSTLLSSIKIPKVLDGEILYILIDSYPEFLSISQDSIKTELIKDDTNLLIHKLSNSIEGDDIEIKFIIDKDTFDSINLVYPEFSDTICNIKNSKVTQSTVANVKMHNYLCDDVFGKVIGGHQQIFNGTLAFRDYTIVDVYSDNKISSSLRGSGLYLMGNGTSKIFVILEKESDDSVINITESTSGTVLFERNLSDITETHPHVGIITEIFTISHYNKEIESCLLSKSVDQMKEFMLKNSKSNTELELYQFEDIQTEEKVWYYNNLKLRIQELIDNSRLMFNSIRKYFVFTKDFDIDFQQNISMQRQYTCASKNEIHSDMISQHDPLLTHYDPIVSFHDHISVPPPVLRRH